MPHSLGKSHTNLGTQLTDIKNMYNLVPRAFPLKLKLQGKSPGNEVEICKKRIENT